MLIHNLIVHKIISDQYISTVTFQKRSTEIPLPNDNASNLLSSISTSFGKDRDIAFAGFNESSWFPLNLKGVIDTTSTFLNFTESSLPQLKTYMELVPAATGGYLVYIYYEDDDNTPQFLVILVKDHEGIGINESLDLESIQSLDIEKLHFAAKININRWQSNNPREKKNHISFLKGKNREKVVEYFKAFLGIDESLYSDPHQHNYDLVNTLKNFSFEELDYEHSETMIRRVHELAEQKFRDGEYISLQEISSLVVPDNPDKFIDYINQHHYELPGEFPVEMKIIEKLNKFQVKTKDYYISFDRYAIDERIIWINDSGNLEISGVPEDLKREFPSY